MSNLIYRGKSLSEYGIFISGSGTFNAPERDTELIDIPGRNGSIEVDNKRLKNISVSYPCFISSKFRENAHAARAWLLAKAGYNRIEDDYDPEFFRLGRFTGPIDWEMRFLNKGGESELLFDCLPQRFAKSGESTIRLSSAGSVYNPFLFDALPIIKIYGNGACALNVGETEVSISSMTDTLTLDCEKQNASKGTQNKNSDITAPSFPALHRGANGISWTGGITGIDIIPRWWTV